MIGQPEILARDGTFVSENLRAVGSTESDALELIPERGYAAPAELAYIIREADGSVGGIPQSSQSLRRARSVRAKPP